MSTDTKQFGKIRSLLWPIHSFELKKVIPMLLMFSFIIFTYNLLRGFKDSLVVTAADPEILTYLKIGCTTPAAILYMLYFATMSNMFGKRNLFYAAIAPFIVFFILFGAVLYPLREVLHPTAWADALLDGATNSLLINSVNIIKYWTFSLFYIFAELWGSVLPSLLFWGLANDITKVTEAKRFYSLFGIGANLALMVAGKTAQLFSTMHVYFPSITDQTQVTVNCLMLTALGSSAMIIAIHSWIYNHVLTDPRLYNPEESAGSKKKSKPKLSLGESIKYIVSSRYLMLIAAIVVSYGVSILLIEITWKTQLKAMYQDPNDYYNFMGQYTFYLGATTVFMMLFVGSNMMRYFGWLVSALFTPVVLLLTGLGFFSFIIFQEQLAPYFSGGPTQLLWIAILFGTVQNIMSKAAKYSLFDPTKEMTYIPLDSEAKSKGKAAVDVVGARAGKAGGSALQILLFNLVGPIAVITPHIAVLLFIIITGWIFAASNLHKEFKKIHKEA